MKHALQAAGVFLLLSVPCAQGQTLPAVLALDEAIRIALERHGNVEAADAAVDAYQGAIKQAGYSPNPTLHLQTENWRFSGTPGFSASQDLDVFAFVSQPLETGGKKQRRVELAEADRAIAALQGDIVRWRIRQEVKGAYQRVLAAERRRELIEETRETVARLRGYHEIRVKLGAMPEVDLIKVQLETEKAEMALAAADMEIERAKMDLLGAMGVSDPSPEFTVRDAAAPAPVTQWQRESLLAELTTMALSRRPEARLGEALLDRARAAVNVQRAAARPDVTPYFGYKRSGPFNTLVGGVTIPLPVRHRNTGAIEQSLAEVHQQEAALRATRARIQAEVAASLGAVRRRARMLESMESRMLERARTTSRITLAAYQEGGMELLEVLDAQRSENDVNLLQSQVFHDYRLSQIDLETAVGAESLPVLGAWNRAAK